MGSCLFNMIQVKLLPWTRNAINKLGKGMPCLFLIKLAYYSTTLSDLLQAVASIMTLHSHFNAINILFLMGAILTLSIDCFVATVYVQAARGDIFSIALIQKDDLVNMQDNLTNLQEDLANLQDELATLQLPQNINPSSYSE